MCKVLEVKGRFNILQTSKDYVVVNTEIEYKNHAHFKCRKDIHKLIDLINKGIKPNSHYMQIAAQRLLGDEYDDLREKKKEYYININKGMRK